MKLFGIQLNLPKLNLQQIITYALIAALTIALLIVSKCKSKVTFADCEAIAVSYADTAYNHKLNDVVAHYSRIIDNMPKGDTVVEKVVEYRDHTTFTKNWNDLQKAIAANETLRKKLEAANAHNASITKEQFEKDGGAMVQTVPEEEDRPLIRTVEKDSGDYWTSKAIIYSYGQLVSYEGHVWVNPPTRTIYQKGATEYVTRKNSIGAAVGVIYLDGRNVLYPTTLSYGHKWWEVEAGPVWNDQYQFEGIEAKAKVKVNFK